MAEGIAVHYGCDLSGTLAQRPTNAPAGLTFYATDTSEFYVSTGGGSWADVAGGDLAQTVGSIVGGDTDLGVTGQAAATATSAGGAVTIAGAAGGATSGTGGAASIAGGAGSGGGATGGAASLTGGAGDATDDATAGGAGGAASVTSGAGGANTGGATGEAGGNGGAVSLIGAAGGATDSTGAHAGGAGGSSAITAGAGGNASAGTGDGGAGGDVTLTPGAGGTSAGGNAGAPGKVAVSGGMLHWNTAQVIDMADAAVVLTLVPGTPAGTLLTSNILRVDANSAGTEDLTLPPEADFVGMLVIVNTGGESIVVKDDGAATIDTVATAEFGMFFCDGTAWSGMNVA